MKAKDKALELVENFYEINDKEVSQATNPYISRQHSVLCALVAVAEIISINIQYNGREIENNISNINYWEQVKEELLKL